jgi:hypothetical protein
MIIQFTPAVTAEEKNNINQAITSLGYKATEVKTQSLHARHQRHTPCIG